MGIFLILKGAQIIDMMFLVIDIVKGVQTQTAECLIIGEICCDKLLIILNKLDLIEEAKRPAAIEKMSKRLLKTLENTKFANSPIIAVAANPQIQLVNSSFFILVFNSIGLLCYHNKNKIK